jgi:hypothetical protein
MRDIVRKRFPLAVLILMSLSATSCDSNMFAAASADPSDEEAQLESARVAMDNRDYSGAVATLEGMDDDSNERRKLLAAARLGDAGLDIWEILQSVLSGTSENSAGMDGFFNTIGATVFGTGEERTARNGAMRTTLTELAAAPTADDTSVNDIACFVGALWTVPLISDATTALTTVKDSLSSVSATDCSGLDAIDTSLAVVSTLSTDFRLILNAISSCSFIDTSGSAASLNTVEKQLTSLSTNADKGCNVPDECAPTDLACRALELSCVHDKLTSGSQSTSGDGIISTCELVQGCYDPTACFAL